MNPAQFDKKIIVFKEIKGEDEDGFPIENSREVIAKPWAMFKTLRGNEYVSANAAQHEIISRVVIRYRTGIDARMKIEYKGRIFDIIEPPINDDEQNKTLTIIVKERV